MNWLQTTLWQSKCQALNFSVLPTNLDWICSSIIIREIANVSFFNMMALISQQRTTRLGMTSLHNYRGISEQRTKIVDVLRKIPKFHLISWCGNPVESRSFRQVSRNSPKLYGKCAFPQNFHTSKLGDTSVFYIVTPVNDG